MAERLVDQLLAFSGLAQDLAQWRMACGRPEDDELVIRRPSHDLRPYRLCGSFVSLLLWEGHSLTDVAEQAAHPIATLARS